jgi:hypothetical protein
VRSLRYLCDFAGSFVDKETHTHAVHLLHDSAIYVKKVKRWHDILMPRDRQNMSSWHWQNEATQHAK